MLGSTVTGNCPDCDVAVKFRPSLGAGLVSDRAWELSGFLDGARLGQVTPLVAGDKDAVNEFYAEAYQTLEINAPNLAKKALLRGAGHWVQQERPAEVNRLLIEFLRSV